MNFNGQIKYGRQGEERKTRPPAACTRLRRQRSLSAVPPSTFAATRRSRGKVLAPSAWLPATKAASIDKLTAIIELPRYLARSTYLT